MALASARGKLIGVIGDEVKIKKKYLKLKKIKHLFYNLNYRTHVLDFYSEESEK